MNINKNISIWRGNNTPPTKCHLWIKEDNTLWLYKDNQWVESTLELSEEIESIKAQAVGRKTEQGGEIFNDYTNNIAEGIYSHSEGLGTMTMNQAEHAQGQYNKTSSNIISSIGIGSDKEHRQNAVQVMTDGNIFIKDVGNYDGTNTENSQSLQTVLSEGLYKPTICKIINKYSGMPIGVRGHVQGPAVIEQQSCGDFTDQVWRITKYNEGYYTLVGNTSNLAINPRYGGINNNDVISQDYLNDTASQKWDLIPYTVDNKIYYRILNLNSNLSLTVEYNNSQQTPSTVAGAAIRQTEWTGGAEQLWSFDESASIFPSMSIYWNLSEDITGWMSVDASWQFQNEALIKSNIGENPTNASAYWRLIYNEDGETFKIQNIQNGYYARVYQDSVNRGTGLIVSLDKDAVSTNFKLIKAVGIEDSDNQGYYIQELNSGLVLGVDGGYTTDQVNIIIWPQQDNDIAQICYLTEKYNISTSETNINNKPFVDVSIVNTHIKDTNNPHKVTKSQIGLENVTNDAQVTRAEMGVSGGVATLDESGKVPSEQLPSYVDDVVNVYATYDVDSIGKLSNISLYSDTAHVQPVSPEIEKLYVDITSNSKNYQFIWDGSAYIHTPSGSLILGTEKGTAYDGASGKANEEAIKVNANAISKLQEDLNNYALMELIVKLHATINFSSNRTVIYKGESDTVTLSHSASFDGSPLTYTITVDGKALSNPYTLEDSHTFNAVFAVNNEDPKVVMDINKRVTVNAYYPRYYGALDSESITSEQILALEKQARASNATVNNKTITFSTAAYLWLCVPSNMSVNNVTSSGFGVPMEAPVNVEVTGKGTYKCYRSTSKANAGSVTYNIS